MKTTTTTIPGVLTLKDLETMEPHTVFAHGTIPNSPDWIYMTDTQVGRELMWVAMRGFAPDWTIYIHWASEGIEYIKSNGDKVINPDNVKMLVPCSNEAFKWYRL